MGPPRPSPAELHRERQQFKAQLVTARNEEDDPLAVYHQFVQWTLKAYGENDSESGLVELLEEATREFKKDPLYKTDLRYLKLWVLYARQVERPDAIAIFAYLVANDIGTSYSVLYEEYASLLELDGRRQDAEVVYRKGIKRGVRPLERLKTRYREFQARFGSSSSLATSSMPPPSSSSSKLAAPPDGLRRNAPKNFTSQNRTASASTSTSTSSANLVSLNSTPASRYALMLAPPAPGKRPEKLRFNLSLLFTDEGVEYSIQEARARSMGLLGKKWGPPPASEMTSMPMDFNDDGQKSTRLMALGGRRKSLMIGGGAEPTVTINTKEALADVFGMYNSPEKTNRLAGIPGSKHAPLKKIEPMTPAVLPRLAQIQENGNAMQSLKTPTPAFRPFVDENQQSSRTPALPKFTPFVDPESNKTPFTTPRPVLSLKDPAVPASNPRSENPPRNTNSLLKLKAIREDANVENVFSKVFTPVQTKPPPLAPLRDVFTDDHGKPTPKAKTAPTHERAKSHHDVPLPPPDEGGGLRAPGFTPFVDENAKTPFKVFSRPPEQGNENSNAFTPKPLGGSTFTPYSDAKPAFTPFRDAHVAFTPYVDEAESPAREVEGEMTPSVAPQVSENAPSWSGKVVEIEDDEEEVQQQQPGEDEYQEDYIFEEEEHVPEHYEIPLHNGQDEYEEGESYQYEVPLGGRFGQFNVMTPITERTFEFTSTRSAFGGTPSERRYNREDGDISQESVFIPQQRDEHGAVKAAERLAAELREEEEEDQPLEPLRLSRDPGLPKGDNGAGFERAGSLSLIDTLTLNSQFKPPNPCNPFDPPILTTLLSRIPVDPLFYDLRDRELKMLDSLQKFAKKSKKTNGGVVDVSMCLPVTLDGHRFSVSEKLGEGGFGAVFKARDQGMRHGEEDEEEDDEDEDDEDEDGSSMVALKVVKPRNIWEYHVLRRLHSALPSSLRRSVVLPHALYAFREESFLVLDFCPQGTLLNIVNNATAAGVSQQGACLDELLVMFFTVELLRLLEAMHSAGFIHGDLKIDNCLLRLEDVPGGASAWSSLYQPSGDGGWSSKGLKLIDFGRTIDTRLFPAGQQYIAEWATDERDCFEIREDRPWTFQTDYFGLAGIIYCMLFGKYIQGTSVAAVSSEDGEQRHKISTPLKRYWQTDIWNRLFDVLLNPSLLRPDGHLPVCEELGSLRGEMEAWLQANCNRTSNTLKGLLKKVEVSCLVH